MSGLGHAREKRPGRWELKVYVGRDPLTSKKRYAYRTVSAKNQREADIQAALFAAELSSSVPSADITFGELLEKWYAIAGPRMVPAGQRETRWMIDTRLRPLHGHKLSILAGRTGTAILDDFYAALRARGGRCRRRAEPCEQQPCEHGGGGPLSDATVVRTHVVVRAALEQAVKWGLVDRNPAEHAYPGEPDPDEVHPPQPGDVVRIFELAEQDDPELVVLLVLSSTTGQRRGAVLALQWDDVDLDTGMATFGHVMSRGPDGPVRVRRGRSKRNRKGTKNVVPLDPAVAAILLAQRARCASRAVLAGVPLTGSCFVFPSPTSAARPRNLDSVSRSFRRLRDAAGLDETRLHDLRHFVVSYLLSSGVDLATVKELVGHAAASETTLRTYAHARVEQKRAATGILARLLELHDAPEPPVPPAGPDAAVIPLRRSS